MAKRSTRNRRNKQKQRKTRRKSNTRGCMVKDLKDGNVVVSHNRQTYTTQNFHVCPGSVFALKKVAKDKPSQCLTFAKMEDRFLGYEIEAVCGYKLFGKCLLGKESFDKMKRLDAKMKSLFGLDLLGYHKMHLTTALQCVGPSPASNMSPSQLGCKQSGGADVGDVVSSWALSGKPSEMNLYMDLVKQKPQGKAQIDFQTEISKALTGSNAEANLSSAVKVTEAYFNMIKADTSERGLYRRMCMLPELKEYISRVKQAEGINASIKDEQLKKLAAIQKQLDDGLKGSAIVADACNKILKASSEQKPVSVSKEVKPATKQEVEAAAQSAVQAAVKGAVEKTSQRIEEQKAKEKEIARAKDREKASRDAAETRKLAEDIKKQEAATKIQKAVRERGAKRTEAATKIQKAVRERQEAKKQSEAATKIQKAVRERQEAKKQREALLASSATEASQASTVAAAKEETEPPLQLTQSEKCPSQDIQITQETCNRSEDSKRILKTLLSPAANVECEDKGKAAAEKLAEFIRLCEKSTAEAATSGTKPEEPKEPETSPQVPSVAKTEPQVETPSAPSLTSPAPVTDEKGCPVVRLQVGQWMCDVRGDELKGLLEKLSKESNPACPAMAEDKRQEFAKLCPDAMASLTTTPEQEEAKPEASVLPEEQTPQEEDEPEQQTLPTQPQESQAQPQSGPTAAQEQPEAGVSTSMQTIPKDGYNEVHIVVKIPSKYQQQATGSTGTTFATAMQSLTQRTKGGAKPHRIPITPKRKNRNISKLLNRKSLKRR